MKHIAGISKARLSSADAFSDVVCEVNEALITLLASKGGTSPLKQFIDSKCSIPPPGGGEGTG